MQAAFHRRVSKIKSVQSPVGLDLPQMGQFWLKSDTVPATMFRNRVGGPRLTLFTGSVVGRSTRVASPRRPSGFAIAKQAGMKSNSPIVWVLGALIAIASVDAVPDPPGVNPRTVSVTSRLCEAGGVCERRLHSDWSTPSHLRMRWIAFSSAYESNLPSDQIVRTGQAADPSPPALEVRRNLYFHS
jgi:hypothetical protein